jgi:hypothetical protein
VARADLSRWLDGGFGMFSTIDARVETPLLRQAARLFTFATLAGEAAIALVFLVPVPAWLREAALLAFCVGTYAIAPVAGFGWRCSRWVWRRSRPSAGGRAPSILRRPRCSCSTARCPGSRRWRGERPEVAPV